MPCNIIISPLFIGITYNNLFNLIFIIILLHINVPYKLIYKERGYDNIARHTAVTIAIKERVSSFNEVEKGFMEEAAILEAKRCLQCNHIWTQEPDRCFLCRNCEEVCPMNCLTVARLDELEHNRFFNGGIPHTVQGITPVRINLELCIRCGLCEQVCPVDAISFKVKKPCETTAKIKITEDVADYSERLK